MSLFRELRMRVSRVEVQAVPGVEEPVEWNRAGFGVGVNVKRDPFRAELSSRNAFAIT